MGDDSDEQLEQRVDQLEQQLSKMLPGRRGVLKGLGAAALGGAAVGGATGGASGQSGPAGRQGTPENPNDMFAWDLDVANQVVTDLDLGDNELRSGSVKTTEANIAGRDYASTADETINVPGDYATIQAAVNALPDNFRHAIRITIDDGDYSDENVLIANRGGGGQADAQGSQGTKGGTPDGSLILDGNGSTPGNVLAGSLYISGMSCKVTAYGMRFTDVHPIDDNDNIHVTVRSCPEVHIKDVEFDGSGFTDNVGIQCYFSNVEAQRVDIGGTNNGVWAKTGLAWCQDITGSAGGTDLLFSEGGRIGSDGSSTDVSGTTGGLGVDGSSGRLYGADNVIQQNGQTDVSPPFDTWQTPNADRPTLVIAAARAYTDGKSTGQIFLDIDDSGGTSADRQFEICRVPGTADADNIASSAPGWIPPGGSYRIFNQSDPDGNNQVRDVQEITL